MKTIYINSRMFIILYFPIKYTINWHLIWGYGLKYRLSFFFNVNIKLILNQVPIYVKVHFCAF